ncbi:hypothetical protein AB0I86_33220 [Streptomyces sp. NPDC049950]|uniref:hypothetical protein n=1 Tax=Streptomyces sp. NPDC049950 TaxID=3156659 RepID=UPI00343369B6
MTRAQEGGVRGRAEAGVAALGVTAPDWDAVDALLQRRGQDAAVVTVALAYLTACAEWRTAEQSGHIGVQLDRYMSRWQRTEQLLIHRLRRRAVLKAAPLGVRRARWRQAQRIVAALDVRGLGVYTMEREEALHACGLIALGVVHHLVAGAALPAICSTSTEWA